MILLRRILPFCAPFLFWLMAVLLQWFPALAVLWVSVSLVSQFLILMAVFQGNMISWLFVMTVIPVVGLLIGGGGLFFFLDARFMQIGWMIIMGLLLGMYLETVFVFHFQTRRYTPFSLPEVAAIVMLVGAFATFSFLFALYLIAVISVSALLVVSFCSAALLMTHTLWIHRAWSRNMIPIVVLVAGLVTEFVWVLHFWPTSFAVNGLLTSILLYCIPQLLQLQLRGALPRATLLRFVVISIIAFTSIVVTAQWT